MSDACRALGIPVVGGNVSFYNESRGRDIDPTPVVGVVGLIDELTAVPPGPALRDGDAIVLLGHTRAELGGSEWARSARPRAAGSRRRPTSTSRSRCTTSCATLVAERVVAGVHDVLRRRARGRAGRDGDRRRRAASTLVARPPSSLPALAWFSESTSRVVRRGRPRRASTTWSTRAPRPPACPPQRLGTAGGDRLVADGRLRRRRSPTPPPRLARRPPAVARAATPAPCNLTLRRIGDGRS